MAIGLADYSRGNPEPQIVANQPFVAKMTLLLTAFHTVTN